MKDIVSFTLQLPKDLNEKLKEEAKELGISKNSYIIMKLQNKVKK